MEKTSLEGQIHARLRELTEEVRTLREELKGSLRRSPEKVPVRAWEVRDQPDPDDKPPQ